MIDEKYIELMNREIDRVNSPQESAKLREYLTQHQEAQEVFNDLGALSKTLSTMTAVEPPSHLKLHIMNSIPLDMYPVREKWNIVKTLINQLFTHITTKEGVMKKKLVFTAALTAVGVVVYFAFFYPWPTERNAEGTIGAVSKHRSEQITEKDVKLEGQASGEAEQASLATRAQLLGRLAVQDKLAAFDKLAVQEKLAAYDRLATQQKLAAFDRLAPQEKLAAFDKLAPQERLAAYDRLATQQKLAAFDRLAPQEKLAAFDKLAPQEKLAAFDRLAAEQKLAAFDKLATQDKLAAFDKLAVSEKAALYDRLPMEMKSPMLNKPNSDN